MSLPLRPSNPLTCPEDWDVLWNQQSHEEGEEYFELTADSGPILPLCVSRINKETRRKIEGAAAALDKYYENPQSTVACVHIVFCEISETKINPYTRSQFRPILFEIFQEDLVVHDSDTRIYGDLLRKVRSKPYSWSFNDMLAVTVFLGK
jgi:hypothetical protein